jgi:hypothetical protein
MKESINNELHKLYDDTRISPFIQEVCEYYATRQDYEDGSYIDEIEPREIVEPVYTLFILQRRETLLDELGSISKRYPNLFTAIADLYNEILIHMDVRPLEKENASRLSLAISEKASGEQIVGKIEELADRYDDLSEALDPFYSWLHSFR